MRRRCLPVLVFVLPLLMACGNREAEQLGALEARITQLEGEVQRLSAELRELQGAGDAERVTELARARTCAFDLVRELEGYRNSNSRYPAASDVTLPDSCADLRVDWRTVTAGKYAFDVRGEAGQLLTQEASD